MTALLLLLGPAGAGKTTVLHALSQRDRRFHYIPPYMTRPLRPDESDKTPVTDQRMNELVDAGELVVVNEMYGVRYGTPRAPILEAFRDGLFPALDWPISRIGVMEQAFPGKLFRAYLEPPSFEALEQRLRSRGTTDADARNRLDLARQEIAALGIGQFDGHIDLRIVSTDDAQASVADTIYSAYMSHLQLSQPERTR